MTTTTITGSYQTTGGNFQMPYTNSSITQGAIVYGPIGNGLNVMTCDAVNNFGCGPGVNTAVIAGGTDNLAFARAPFASLTTGIANLGCGHTPFPALVSGSFNVGLGGFDDVSEGVGTFYFSNESNNILLNSSGVTADQNTMRLGTQGTGAWEINRCFIAGIVGVTTSNSEMVTIDSTTGQLGIASIPGGTVTSVSGTANRVTSTGGTTPVIDISASYVGQSSITTLGTIGTGVWNGTLIGGTYGGTGVNNGSSTLTLGGSLTTSGAFTSTFTMTAGTSVTFPTSGTLATTSQLPSLPLSMANGGTNASLSASNGGIFYSSGTAGAILAGTATASQLLLSGSSTTPSWSTSTYPATNAANTLLYASSANTMAALATANNGVLITSAGGVPSLLANGTTGQVLTATTGSPPSWGAASSGIASITVQTFTSSGTYTPTSGMLYCTIEVVGGGGGGGGVASTGSGAGAAASGGGGGGYGRKTVTAATIGASKAVTVGTGGAGGVAGANNGTGGVTSSVGTIVTATGGTGGNGAASASATLGVYSVGVSGGVGASGDVNANGGYSDLGSALVVPGTLGYGYSGKGGSSIFGSGGPSMAAVNASGIAGVAGVVYGGGGSGAISTNSGASAAGGAGAAGIVIITEYI